MAGTAACCTPFFRCCPFSFPGQPQSTELPATTEGRWRRRHLSPGLLTVLLTCTGCAFQVTPGVEKGVTLKSCSPFLKPRLFYPRAFRRILALAPPASSLSHDLELRVHSVCPLLARHRLAIWSVAVSRPWYAPYFLTLHSTGYNFFIDSLMSHQTLTARHNQLLLQVGQASEFSRLEEEPTIFHFVLAWREGFPEIPRESRGVKGLGRVIGVCSPPPLNTLAGLNQFRTITL